MFEFIKNQIKNFNSESTNRLLKILIGFALLIILYAGCFSGFQIVDEFEHLHASWLVSIGKLPYVDFFEHHNPLLWYISAPIVSFFYNNIDILYVMRIFSSIISAITLYYIFNICLLFTNKTGALFAIALSLINIITIYNFYQFRPDNFMNLGFIIGLYYWLSYIKYKTRKHLIFSFISFSLSALFLQKISLLLILVELIILVLLFYKKMKLKDTTIAGIPAIMIVFLFFGFLLHKDILLEYLELNYHFNKALVYYFQRGAFWYNNLTFSLYGIAFITSIYFFKKETIYFKIIAIIYIAEFIMRTFYFAPHPNYYTLLTFLSSIILSIYPQRIIKNNYYFMPLIIISMFLYLGKTFKNTDISIQKHNAKEYIKFARYIHENSSNDDLLMNGYDKNFNIYRNDASYYWFGLDMLLPVMEVEYKITNKININSIILQKRPKFIYAASYPDLMAYRKYGEQKIYQSFNPNLINHLYKKAPFDNLFILK